MKKEQRVLSGLGAYFKYLWREKKVLYLLALLFFPFYILANFLQVYLPKMVVEKLEEKDTIENLIISILVIAVGLGISIFLREKILARVNGLSSILVQNMQNDFIKKTLYSEYNVVGEKGFIDIKDMIKESIFGGSIGSESYSARYRDFAKTIMMMLAVLGNICLYVYYLWFLSPWMIVIIIPTSLIGLYTAKLVDKNEKKYSENSWQMWDKMNYVTRRTEDFTMAKDIRLYHMQDWLSGLTNKFCNERASYKRKEMIAEGAKDIAIAVAMGIQNACLFAYILIKTWNGNLTISDLVFYAGIGPALSTLINELTMHLNIFFKLGVQFNRFQAYMNYGGKMEFNAEPLHNTPPLIQLENVSYRYPEAEKDVLRNLNLTVRPGEKIAIVGVNGAGKTTLMKLICGLIHPTTGNIYINGMNMKDMTAEERYAWFSCAFQDVHFLPLTIRDNISMHLQKDADEKRIWECLRQAGIDERVRSLPDKLDSLMDKNINENGVDFSGGERQKLILARAIYRNTGVLILDEPTAALDPIAENDIYQKYAYFANGKTSFFVSHRLSSTRFCDRILLIDGGNVAESGTHDELLSKGGIYANMFALQSKYYEGGAEA